MTSVLVLYYSSYGHVERMARAVAEGVNEVSGAKVKIKRVPGSPRDRARREAGSLNTIRHAALGGIRVAPGPTRPVPHGFQREVFGPIPRAYPR